MGQNEKPIKVQAIHLTKKFGDLLVLDDVSFDVKKGEFLCIVGPTGCGKTTFLNCMTNLFQITEGEILVDGEPVDPKKHNIAYIFQENSIMQWLTVRQNIAFCLQTRKMSKKEKEESVDEFMELVGLSKYSDYYPRQLSSSMVQRVSIARAFASKPELLLMDEPYGQLDLILKYKLEDELLKLWRKTRITIIFITHNIEEAVYLAQRILVLTNKPTSIKESVDVEIPYPRDISSPKFVEIRNRVTDLIKWW